MASAPASFPPHDFDFAFDPAAFPPPPPLPPSADLFSPSETTNLFGFLENFNWELDADLFQTTPKSGAGTGANNLTFGGSLGEDLNVLPPMPQFYPLMPPAPPFSPEHTQSRTSALSPVVPKSDPSPPPPSSKTGPGPTRTSRTSRSPSSGASAGGSKQAKALLSTPQKRLNHIMSEQKRRNAIRDGYAQLTTLLAPKGAPPGSGMPTRGRPKGSGASGKGRTKGKSGVLFRAVEYIHWLDEGLDALRAEVVRVEQMAGIQAQ